MIATRCFRCTLRAAPKSTATIVAFYRTPFGSAFAETPHGTSMPYRHSRRSPSQQFEREKGRTMHKTNVAREGGAAAARCGSW